MSNILLGAVVSGILAGAAASARADVPQVSGQDAVELQQQPAPTPAPRWFQTRLQGPERMQGSGRLQNRQARVQGAERMQFERLL